MNVIYPYQFKVLEDCRLNRDGKIIGQIVKYKENIYYKSFRTSAHYFIKYKGFGIDSTLFMKLLDREFNNELQKRLGIRRRITGIIIEYQGRKEHRFYFADMDTFFMNKINYGTAKQTEDEVESYGRQFILPRKFFTLLGVAPDDSELNQPKELKKYA